MRMFSACHTLYSINLIHAAAFFAVCIFFNCTSGVSGMRTSHYVGASNLTNKDANLSFENRGLMDVGTSERIGEACAKEDIVVYQGATTPMPNGIPTYTVQILNVCVTGCPIAGIHLTCGWFSSARLINPKIFKRLRYNDCLVNDGKPLKSGGSISFQYANTYRYAFAVSSVKCLP
ncbi:hypothetical protein SUGI_0960500 [Cryptomeria japonica]|uniref:TPD1 protein homolog 1 n=1 Tax=Cryptomeria japonica TaxID=3369 RepID=UPI00241472FD|nr:TPD1 protein homolog 1 [Cryptomeria japonica]XP_057863392.1 TPD1 protein homolog 1 [Cryptomeria japonica]XP_057863393.1 TPD1 protein homolog 1 [Cryptomeria japonica]XP_057863394.1 TPD1 protein homolog 1 [Cryptomeria japonica]GLJ45632.1 hypothetical protein SUGI_0960500 [Cryptomeria japonica]